MKHFKVRYGPAYYVWRKGLWFEKIAAAKKPRMSVGLKIRQNNISKVQSLSQIFRREVPYGEQGENRIAVELVSVSTADNVQFNM